MIILSSLIPSRSSWRHGRCTGPLAASHPSSSVGASVAVGPRPEGCQRRSCALPLLFRNRGGSESELDPERLAMHLCRPCNFHLSILGPKARTSDRAVQLMSLETCKVSSGTCHPSAGLKQSERCMPSAAGRSGPSHRRSAENRRGRG